MKKFLGSYLKQRVVGVASFMLFFIILLISFALYRLPVKAVIYPVLLCVLAGSIIFTIHFRRAYHKHLHLLELQRMTDGILSAFPEPAGADDKDYQDIIHMLLESRRQLMTAQDARYAEMMDYYTTWAHQIKTPIAAMRLHLQGEDSPLSRKLETDLFHIEQYVEMVMMYLRLGSNSTDYVIKKYDLDSIIKQVIHKYAGEFIDRRISLVYEPVQMTVITDDKWLSFVMEQVVSNALKYTPAGSISIYTEPNKTLCIRDTGIGIAAEDLPRVFEKGYTGYNGRKDKAASGLGLYLCRRICRNLGHRIEIESAPGKGTTVRIDLEQDPLETE